MDKFAAIREAGIDGLNYDLTTDDIIAKLREWDERFGIEVNVADASIVVTFETLPEAPFDFVCEEVGEFCIDAITQVVGSDEEAVERLEEERVLILWWD